MPVVGCAPSSGLEPGLPQVKRAWQAVAGTVPGGAKVREWTEKISS